MIALRYPTRHSSPWALQAHGFSLVIGVACVVLAAPFASRPTDLPLPMADPSKIEACQQTRRALGAKLEPALEREVLRGVGGPHFDLRALGTAVRAYGLAESQDDRPGVEAARTKLLAAAAQAQRTAATDLPAFRAYQAELFLRELRSWERVGVVSKDLEELGGAFLAAASRYGWIGPRRELLMSEAMGTILFERRWNEITGLSDPNLALSLDETRAFYAFLLAPRKVASSSARGTSALGFESRKRMGAAAISDDDEWRLRKVEEIERVDPTYPADLARGLLQYRLGQYGLAERTLARPLATSGEGEYSMRVRNGWLAARSRVLAAE